MGSQRNSDSISSQWRSKSVSANDMQPRKQAACTEHRKQKRFGVISGRLERKLQPCSKVLSFVFYYVIEKQHSWSHTILFYGQINTCQVSMDDCLVYKMWKITWQIAIIGSQSPKYQQSQTQRNSIYKDIKPEKSSKSSKLRGWKQRMFGSFFKYFLAIWFIS